MNSILITNYSYYDKEYIKTFAEQQKYKFVSISSGTSTLVPLYKELLREIIDSLVENTFKDKPLSELQTKSIQSVFANRIKEELENRDASNIKGFARRTIFGKEYKLDLKLNPNNDRMIEDMHKIYLIAEECLQENKPMYLSIEND